MFCLAGTLVMISDQAKTQFLPLRLTQQLHLQPSSIGLLFGFQAVLELLTMPLTGRLADRLGMTPVLLITFALPIPYLLGVSSATSLGPLFALQILQASAVAGAHWPSRRRRCWRQAARALPPRSTAPASRPRNSPPDCW
jgi:MFS family permease